MATDKQKAEIWGEAADALEKKAKSLPPGDPLVSAASLGASALRVLISYLEPVSDIVDTLNRTILW